ncbi:MAG: hypothetical protein AAF844_15185 [Pseudomonadota bacterium]
MARPKVALGFCRLIAIDVALKIFGILGVLSPDANDGAGPVVFFRPARCPRGLRDRDLPPTTGRRGLERVGLGALLFAERAVIVGASILLLHL